MLWGDVFLLLFTLLLLLWGVGSSRGIGVSGLRYIRPNHRGPGLDSLRPGSLVGRHGNTCRNRDLGPAFQPRQVLPLVYTRHTDLNFHHSGLRLLPLSDGRHIRAHGERADLRLPGLRGESGGRCAEPHFGAGTTAARVEHRRRCLQPVAGRRPVRSQCAGVAPGGWRWRK